MEAAEHLKNSWITPQQELLLKATLSRGEAALSAWEKWKSGIDFDRIDPGSYRLLPLLYYNISKHNVTDPLIERCKGIYRRTWCENQLASHEAEKLLELLHNSGIKTIILKGISLSMFYYQDYGLRPMTDFDILVPTGQAYNAINLLKKSGWIPRHKSPEELVSFIHSCDFTDRTGLYRLDLHWHLFMESCKPDADIDFWESAVPVTIKNIPAHILNPADQLLHTLVHGMKWNIIPPFRWAADAIFILENSNAEIDWNRLLSLAEKHRLVLQVRYGLEYLKNELNAGIPNEILQRISNTSVTKTEYREFRYKIQNQKKKLLGDIPSFWYYSLRLSGNRSLLYNISMFINYLKHFWNLETMGQLPVHVLTLGINKIKMLLSR